MKIQIFNNISEQGLAKLKGYDFNETKSPDAILLRSENLHEHQFDAKTLAVGRAGAGVNNIPVDRLSDQGIVVFNTPGANANAVKELVIAAMLVSSRNVIPATKFVSELSGTKEEMAKLAESGKKRFVGNELSGKTLGVIGLGAIGVMLSNAAEALGMKVIGYDPMISIQNAWRLSSGVERADNLNYLYSNCDYLSFHLPLTEQTKDTLGEDHLSQLKPGVRVFNFARAGVVSHKLIAEGIKQDVIKGYMSDFPDPDISDLPGVVSLPHLGASTYEAQENCSLMICDQIKNFLENGIIKNSVNFPDVELSKSADSSRIAIVNRNQPNLIAKISTLMGEANINISEMINKSRGDYAYTLIDTNSDIDESLIGLISRAEGVIKARKVF